MSGTSLPRMTRRRMVAVSGAAVGAPLSLAACGTTSEEDDRSEANDPELLNAVLAQHLAVVEVADTASSNAPEEVVPSLDRLRTLRERSAGELEAFISERDGDATTEPADRAQAESPSEAVSLQLEDSIAESLEVIGDLSAPAYRQAVHRFITEDAAALAALRSQLGGDIAPDAFVFGAPSSTEDSE